MSNFKQKNHLPYTFRLISWRKQSVNLDIGGGQFNLATDYLAKHGVRNLVYDPFRRGAEHNDLILKLVDENPVDTVTVNNVLNTIREESERLKVIRLAAKALKPGGTAYFLIHEGDRSGLGCLTLFCWQNNMRTDAYLSEISRYFKSVRISRNLIIAGIPHDYQE